MTTIKDIKEKFSHITDRDSIGMLQLNGWIQPETLVLAQTIQLIIKYLDEHGNLLERK